MEEKHYFINKENGNILEALAIFNNGKSISFYNNKVVEVAELKDYEEISYETFMAIQKREVLLPKKYKPLTAFFTMGKNFAKKIVTWIKNHRKISTIIGCFLIMIFLFKFPWIGIQKPTDNANVDALIQKFEQSNFKLTDYRKQLIKKEIKSKGLTSSEDITTLITAIANQQPKKY